MHDQTDKTKTAAVPKDAAAVILLDESQTKVLWAKRNPKLKFLGGFHSFPGGKVDEDDAFADVRNAEDNDTTQLLACAVREVFEEIGVLIVRNGEKLTNGQRVSLHDDLISGRFNFSDILETWGLWIDAEDFQFAACWTTPEFSPVRFKTRFYIAVCPPKQIPYAAIDELQEIEFIEPVKALDLWSKSEILVAPPVLISLRGLQKTVDADTNQFSKAAFVESQTDLDEIEWIELNPRLICFPLCTKTLPPATHTNCFIVGKRDFVVIDAATREPAEQQKLFRLIDEFIENGFNCKAIIVSHLHPDHFGGEGALQTHLREKFDLEIPILAHQKTSESLDGIVAIDRFINDNDDIDLSNENGDPFNIRALHTPGHARGHLCFYDEEFGFLLSSDNVVGLGSVLIAPPEGNMIDYLNSLERMKNLPNLNFLCGSHGAAVSDATGKIEEYIAHRQERERKIIEAMESGLKSPAEIVEKVYSDVSPKLWKLAEKSVEAHIEKLADSKLKF